MGNCLKSPGGANDDISLLRDSNTNNSNSVEQLQQPPTYVQVHILNYIGQCPLVPLSCYFVKSVCPGQMCNLCVRDKF